MKINELKVVAYCAIHDYDMIKSWWDAVGEVAPLPDMLPEDTTFIVERKNEPWLCVTVFTTNSGTAWIENLIANPGMKKTERKMAIGLLQEFLEGWCREKGFKRMLCMSHKEKLSERYQELGYRKTLSSVETFIKIL